MPSDDGVAVKTDSIGMKALKLISSFGHYGMIVGALQAVYGVYRWDKTFVIVGVCGAIFSFGWMILWDWIIAKAAPRA